MKLTGQERILVVKPSSLGDIVHTLPAVSAIHRQFPKTQIDWLVNTEWAPLLSGLSFLNSSIPFPRREFRGAGGLFRARRWARETFAGTEYDLALDFQGLLRSALLARVSRARTRIGFSNAREGAANLYHQSICVQDWAHRHAVDRYRDLVESLEIPTTPVEFPLPEGSPIELPQAFADNPIVIHPFSRGTGKSLSQIEVRELCEKLAPHPVILVGRTEESESENWSENVLNLLNQTDLNQLIYLLRKAAWTISVDSGPMHLAAGISDRVLSLHTWTDPKMVGPWRPDAWIFRDGQLVRIGDLAPGQFPEYRDQKREYATRDRLYKTGEIHEIADFTLSQVSS